MEKVRAHIKHKQLTISPHWRLFTTIGVALFLAFIGFTLLVREDMLRSWDFNMTVRLQDDVPLRLDEFFSFLSVIGRFEYTFPMLLVILIWRRRLLGIIPFALFGFAHVIELIGKTILEQPGPPRMFLRSHYSEFPGLHVFTEASYPSGHSLRAVFLAIIVTYLVWNAKRLPRAIKLGIYSGMGILLSLILVSRVSLGEHWSTDVIGGSLLGASFAILSLIFI